MINHTWVLNFLAKKYKLKSYLEIGVHTRSINFDKIVCEDKVCVDPAVSARADFEMTSDEYFEHNCDRKFDLIFIDGLHHAEQVKKDFENSLKCLNESGFIMLHDTNPELEKYATRERNTKIWNGDVYKFAVTLPAYGFVNFITVNVDHGCTIVWKEDIESKSVVIPTWQEFDKNRHQLLNLVSLQDFTKFLPDAITSTGKKHGEV